ncbi:hypothetical protein Anas_00440, partial [Armadillidium nasatum]
LESECYPTVSLTEAEGSRAPEKPPLFSKPLQNKNNENNDGGSSFLESSPPLQRHLSTETLSCCGDCGCVPEEEVLDLNTDISTSPFPLIELNEVSEENEGADLENEGADLGEDGKDPLSNEPRADQVPKQTHSQELHHRLQIQTQNQQPQQQQQQQQQQHYHQQQLNETTNQFLNNQQVAVITVSSAKTNSSEVTTLSKARRINKSIVITPKAAAATSHRQSFATQNNFSKTQPQTQPQPPSFVSAATDDKMEFRNSTLVLRRDSITTVSSTKDS